MPVQATGLSQKGLKAEFGEAFRNTPTYWQDLSTRIISTTDEEKYGWLGSVPNMREWGQGRLAKGLHSESYRVENMKYEATIEVDRDEIDDDQTNQIRMRINELAAAAATHKDKLLEQLLINGESSGWNAYDGFPFFSDSHVTADSGVQSNLLTSTATDTDNPTSAEFRTAIQKAIATMIAYRDDIGEPRRIMPTGFVCVVPPTMLFTAMEALSLQMIPNPVTVMQPNSIQAVARVIAMPGLTDASKWYLCKTDVPVRPFIFQDRAPVEFQAIDYNSEEGFKREKFLYGVRARYRMTYGHWYYAARIDFVGGE